MTASLTDDERHEYLIEEGDFDDARCVDPDLAERIWRALLTFFHAKMESLTSGIPASYNPGEESVDQHAAAEKSSDFLKSGFANTADRM